MDIKKSKEFDFCQISKEMRQKLSKPLTEYTKFVCGKGAKHIV